MPIIAHEPQADQVFEPFYTPPPDEVRPTGLSTWGAAFSLENDVVNAINFFQNQRTYDIEEGFDIMPLAKTSAAFKAHPAAFTGVQSTAEFKDIELEVLKEQANRQTLDQAGWGGVGAAMTAGVLSPTLLVPFGAGARAATVGKAALGAAGWGFVAGALQEIPLQANQRLRTTGETALAVGSSTILSGLLGAGIRKLDPLGWDKAVKDMDVAALQADISKLGARYGARGVPSGPQSLSAAATRTEDRELFPDPGKPLNMETAIGRVANLSATSPVVRQLVKDEPIFRSAMYQLSNAGLISKNNMAGTAGSQAGDVESRIQAHHARMANAIHKLQGNFAEWRAGQGKSRFGSRVAFKDWNTYMEEVTTASLQRAHGTRHPDKNINAAADEFLSYFSRTLQDAKKLNMSGFTNLPDQDFMKIALQNVRKDLALEGNEDLRAIIRQHVVEQLDNPDVRKNPKIKEWLKAEFGETRSNILSKSNFADDVATKMLQRWTSEYSRHGTVDTLIGLPIPHQFTIIDPGRLSPNGVAFKEFLEPNIERIARSFTRSMAPDIELQRTFGTVNPLGREAAGTPLWSEIEAWRKAELEKIAVEEEKAIKEIEATGGTRDGARAAKEIAKAKKARGKVAQKEKEFARDFGVVVERLRHRHGVPQDPNAIGFRLGRTAINMNTVRLMGMVTISSVADLARLTMKHGFVNVMRDGLIPMFADWKKMKLGFKEAEYSGAALDVITHSRTSEIFDLFDDAGYGSFMERGLQTMTNKIGVVAGFDYWNDGLKKFTGTLLISDLSRALDATAAGKADKATKAFLGSLGIDNAMAARLWKKYQNGGATEVRKGVWLPNTRDWVKIDGVHDRYVLEEFRHLEAKDIMPEGLDAAGKKKFEVEFKQKLKEANEGEELQAAFRAALWRGITNTIIQPGVERPIWMDASTAGRVIGQFRSFGMSSQFKTLAAAGQMMRSDAGGVAGMSKIGSGIMMSLALGALSYYLWGQSLDPTGKGGSAARKRMMNEFKGAINGDTESLARIADEAIARAGLTGAWEEGRRVAERIPALQDYVTLANTPTTRSPFVEPITEALGPTVGLFKELDTLAREGVPPTGASLEAVQALMPYQNVFWLRSFFDSLVDHTKEAIGADD